MWTYIESYMIRRLTIVGLVSLLLLTESLFAVDSTQPPSDDEVAYSLTVIVDCVSASLVTECTDSGINLPCSNVSMDLDSKLPKRIAYFLADPSEYVTALAPAESTGGFLAALMSLLNSAADNPLVSAVYVIMSTREYTPGAFLLSGSISFDYPEGATLDDVLDIWSSRVQTDQNITMHVDIQVFGNNMNRPLAIAGDFAMYVDKDGSIVVESIGVYSINEYHYQGGRFRM